MSQPVKLSDSLVLDARVVGKSLERSIAGQVEFWAKLGRAVESLLQGGQAIALCRRIAVSPLSSCLDKADSAAGRRRVAVFLEAQPYPHYEPAPGDQGLIVRIEADGKRTVGRFVNRRFKAAGSRPVKR